MWRKVVAPAVLVSLVWIVGNSITNHYMHTVYDSHSRALAENVATIRAGWAMQDALWRLEAVAIEAAAKDPGETRIEVHELQSAFLQHLDDAERTSFTNEERILVKAVREHFAVYRNHVESRLEPFEPDRLPAAQAAEREKTIRLAHAVAEPCRRLTDLNERILTDSTARSARLSALMSVIRMAFLIAGPTVGLLCGLWIARGLRRSLSQISVTLKDATGDLDCTVGSVQVSTQDDLPALQQQVRAVAERIRQVMDELQESRRKAMRTERLAAVGELAAGVAHELRNPLTSVKLLIQTAARRQDGAALQDKQLQVARQEITRMENTIQGLLDFARPPQLHSVVHDLRQTVRRALNLVAGRARQQQVQIAEEFPETPAVVDGDPEQLHQVFVNLSLNGIEAMLEGGQLRVIVSADGNAAGMYEVVFQDTGPGIRQEILGRIFQPFVTTKEHGTGLGLAISRRIVEQHGGTLNAANRQQGGAAFTVALPLSPAQVGSRVGRDV